MITNNQVQENKPPHISFGSRLANIWNDLVGWLTKVMAIIAFMMTFAVMHFVPHFDRLHITDYRIKIALVILCFIVIFFVLFALFSLLKHVVMAGLIISLILLLVYIPSHLNAGQNKTTEAGPRICDLYKMLTDTKSDSIIHALNSSVRILNYKIDSLTFKVDTLT